MEMARSPAHVALCSLALLLLLTAARSATFTLTNNCGYTVWPGLLSGAGTAPLPTTGFALARGASAAVDAPATLAEFTLDGSGGLDFFDVSLVDGYNVPMLIVPQGAGGGGGGNGSGGAESSKCMATGCLVDLNGACPADLRVMAASSSGGGGAVACRSACEAFGTPQYCCSGAYGNPSTCRPSTYSQFFKNACPRAYSYAYDDSTSTFTCATGIGYAITFCPSTTSGKYSGENPQAASATGTMVYLGGEQLATGASATAPRASQLLVAAAALTAVALLDLSLPAYVAV